jgi:hypothetical protein
MATQLQDMHPQTRQNPWQRILKRRWPNLVLIFIAGSLCLGLAACKSKGEEAFADLPDVGKRTLAKYEIPAETVKAFAARNNKPEVTSTQNQAVDMPSWTASTAVELTESTGPFMAVLVVDGTVEGAGSRARYTISWEGLESAKLNNGTLGHFAAFGHYGESKDKYPLTVHKAIATTPFRVEKNQKVNLSVSSEEIKGIVPTRMTLELRAGIGGGMQNWRVLLQWMLPGLVMVFVWWWLFKRER